MSVEDYAEAADAFLRAARTRRSAGRYSTAATRRWSSCCATWRPTASPTTSPRAATATSCAPVTEEIYGIPPERVIGSSNALRYQEDGDGGSIVYIAEADVFDDGPVEAGADLEPRRPPPDPRRRQLQRRRPDAPLRRRAGPAGAAPARPPRRRRARVRHYTGGAEQALAAARDGGWTVVSVKDDWSTVFADVAG